METAVKRSFEFVSILSSICVGCPLGAEKSALICVLLLIFVDIAVSAFERTLGSTSAGLHGVPMTYRVLLTSWALLALTSTAHSQTPDTTRYVILTANRQSGVLNAWTERDGTRGFYMEFNDRGRGPALTQRVKVG